MITSPKVIIVLDKSKESKEKRLGETQGPMEEQITPLSEAKGKLIEVTSIYQQLCLTIESTNIHRVIIPNDDVLSRLKDCIGSQVSIINTGEGYRIIILDSPETLKNKEAKQPCS